MPNGKHLNPQFAIRVPRDLLDKFRYVAEFNARSANREMELLMKKHVDVFESEHGTIDAQSLSDVLAGKKG